MFDLRQLIWSSVMKLLMHFLCFQYPKIVKASKKHHWRTFFHVKTRCECVSFVVVVNRDFWKAVQLYVNTEMLLLLMNGLNEYFRQSIHAADVFTAGNVESVTRKILPLWRFFKKLQLRPLRLSSNPKKIMCHFWSPFLFFFLFKK